MYSMVLDIHYKYILYYINTLYILLHIYIYIIYTYYFLFSVYFSPMRYTQVAAFEAICSKAGMDGAVVNFLKAPVSSEPSRAVHPGGLPPL
jgi:hypothetical protein